MFLITNSVSTIDVSCYLFLLENIFVVCVFQGINQFYLNCYIWGALNYLQDFFILLPPGSGVIFLLSFLHRQIVITTLSASSQGCYIIVLSFSAYSILEFPQATYLNHGLFKRDI